MIKKLSQWRTGVSSSGLLAVDGIESGVDPQANGGIVKAPGRDVLL